MRSNEEAFSERTSGRQPPLAKRKTLLYNGYRRREIQMSNIGDFEDEVTVVTPIEEPQYMPQEDEPVPDFVPVGPNDDGDDDDDDDDE
jgi:hypothetical protein